MVLCVGIECVEECCVLLVVGVMIVVCEVVGLVGCVGWYGCC